MSSPNKKKSARRRKIILWVLVILLSFTVVRFLMMRSDDKTAWPAGAPGVSLEVEVSERLGQRVAGPADVAAVMTHYVAADEALIAEYRTYQTFGIRDQSDYPLIDKRLNGEGAWLSTAWKFWRNFDGFDPKPGALSYNEFIGVNAELGVLACYGAQVGKVVENVATDPAEARYEVMSNAVKLTHGGGLIGRFAALNNVMLVVREMIMDPVEFKDVNAATAYVSRVRDLEVALGSLSDALRTDLVSLHAAVRAMYGQLSGDGPIPEKPSHRIGGASGIIVGLLGGNEQDTLDNLDSLFSRLIYHASLPYSPEGLGRGLPAWCRAKARPPSTRDPIGAAVASSYLKHAVFAQAVAPSLILELRAARVVVALKFARQTSGEYPTTLDELVAAGLLDESDLVDPFAQDGKARISYARDGEGWRFYSVGLDQEDGGGLVDAYRTTDPDAQSQSDFVFLSRERETRMAMRIPKKTAAGSVHGIIPTTNGVENAEGK